VALPQQALLNLLAWQLKHTALAEGARTLQFTSLSFDVSFQEIFTTWCSGGTLLMVTETVRRDVERLARFIADHNVGRLFLPFVALQQLAEVIIAQPSLSLNLKEVITAGEQLQITNPLSTYSVA
jgi:non-ribosomal peptide synthetase component F